MKTTLVIDDGVLAKLRREAAREGKTISELVEAALRLFLERRPPAVALPPLPTFKLGQPKVDLADRDALYRAMEEDEG
ncbi:MAG: ribbon-helix-helix protein, CopG family [Deltaproteobacteria bacterium]|nr:ribbon-helix-helix protein, CopG family [Deltaproteobacteria bacterium]